MSLQQNATNEELTQFVMQLFGGWAKTPTVEQGKAYVKAWAGLSVAALTHAIKEANREGGDFIPSAGTVRQIALDWLGPADFVTADFPTAEQISTGTAYRQDDGSLWPEAQEFLDAYHKISESISAKEKNAKVFRRPTVDTRVSDAQQKELVDWYLRQNLNDRSPRAKWEIAAIKSHQPRNMRRKPLSRSHGVNA